MYLHLKRYFVKSSVDGIYLAQLDVQKLEKDLKSVITALNCGR